jgi:3-deoxy-D-arabino-heptulosonate 7-phosphate (DAHP) synthase
MEIAPQKELKSKFKLQIITIFALKKTIMNIKNIPQIKHTDSGNFFLLAGPCAIESEEMAMQLLKN